MDYTVLATIPVEEPPEYWFLGGMCYKEDDLSFRSAARIEYPFTTYFRRKIDPFTADGVYFRPLAELRLPLLVYQFASRCDAYHLPPVFDTGEGTVYPFIGYDADAEEVMIVVPDTVTIREKEAEWLGRASKKTYKNPEPLAFSLSKTVYDDWMEAVRDAHTGWEELDVPGQDRDMAYRRAKQALYRSWDEELGTFLQLPWRDRPGFALDTYSYGLLAYEAVRIDYFDHLFRETGDDDYQYWCDRLWNLFSDDRFTIPAAGGTDAQAWCNMIEFNGTGLTGSVYLGTGFYGYPGGQAMIAFHLLRAIERGDHEEDRRARVQPTVEYIMDAQRQDGMWPMAEQHRFELPFKRHAYEDHVSEGATAACVRALLVAARIFDKPAYREAARYGLSALMTDHPVCRNGLRDIGTDEPEAFSAFAVVHAFLDAYEEFGEDRYLDQAERYAHYLITWNYGYRIGDREIRGINHPIAETITMRLSPYETLLAARVYRRLTDHGCIGPWEMLYDRSIDQVLSLQNDSGGLSEGIFFDHTGDITPLHTEQTFATAELVRVLAEDGHAQPASPTPHSEGSPQVEEDDGVFTIPALDTVFDANRLGFTTLAGTPCTMDLCFGGPYTRRSQFRAELLRRLRGHKMLLGVRDIDALWGGIQPEEYDYPLIPVSEVGADTTTTVDDVPRFTLDTKIHNITGNIMVNQESRTVHIPLTVRTNAHDISCNRVLLRTDPVTIDADTITVGGATLQMDGAHPADDGLDLSLAANWTHGGLYRGVLSARLPD